MKNLLENPKFAEVVSHFENCCKASRDHSKLAGQALDEFGDNGPLISGVVRDHFPEGVKNELRELCSTINRESDLAWSKRPKYTRNETMRELGRLVARRDGSGFYGPRG